MASVARSDPKLRKPFPKPLMLKDFLSDDMSSCSSNGFKSFPRRHCCTTVRYLVEKDFKAKDSTKARRLLRKSRSKAAASTTISALQRASEAVINAVKLLPFSSVKAPSFSVKNRSRKGILPRSFSRKFWKRTAVEEEIEIERWKSFHDFLEEKQKSSAHIRHHSTTTTTTIDSTSATSNSNSWSDGEFTLDYLQFSSCNSVSSGENDAVSRKKYLPEKMVSKRVGVAVGGDSMEATSTTCSEKKEKVRVLISCFACVQYSTSLAVSKHLWLVCQALKIRSLLFRFNNLKSLIPIKILYVNSRDRRVLSGSSNSDSWN